jgi:glutathione S-transferase
LTGGLTIWTWDWVPDGPRGHVRDIRLRWAAEEAGLPYRIATVPIRDRGQAHLARQPFAQAPFLDDGDLRIFESGACLMHLADNSEVLMPRHPAGRAEVMQWIVAALNSIEMVTVPFWFINLKNPPENPLAGWMATRFRHLDAVLARRDWLATGRFTAADILMADVLRMPLKKGDLTPYPALLAYVERATARPAFQKALSDQMAHFSAADAALQRG